MSEQLSLAAQTVGGLAEIAAKNPDPAKKVVTFTAAAAGKRRTKTGLVKRTKKRSEV